MGYLARDLGNFPSAGSNSESAHVGDGRCIVSDVFDSRCGIAIFDRSLDEIAFGMDSCDYF